MQSQLRPLPLLWNSYRGDQRSCPTRPTTLFKHHHHSPISRLISTEALRAARLARLRFHFLVNCCTFCLTVSLASFSPNDITTTAPIGWHSELRQFSDHSQLQLLSTPNLSYARRHQVSLNLALSPSAAAALPPESFSKYAATLVRDPGRLWYVAESPRRLAQACDLEADKAFAVCMHL